MKYPLFVNIIKSHKVPTQIFLALAQPTPECLMSDAGQVTADEGGQVGRWAGHQWCSGFPSILTLSHSLRRRLHGSTDLANAPWHQPAPGSTSALVRSCCWRRRTFLHRCAAFSLGKSLDRKGDNVKKIGDKSKNLQGQLGSPICNEKSSFPVIKQVRSSAAMCSRVQPTTVH